MRVRDLFASSKLPIALVILAAIVSIGCSAYETLYRGNVTLIDTEETESPDGVDISS